MPLLRGPFSPGAGIGSGVIRNNGAMIPEESERALDATVASLPLLMQFELLHKKTGRGHNPVHRSSPTHPARPGLHVPDPNAFSLALQNCV